LDRALEALAAEIASGNAAAAQATLDGLLRWSALGSHLITPWQVVFAGRPNVGKSSLINALVGYQRAIVHDTPGTTRDVVTATSALDGWPVELADTAGLRSTGEALEAAGIRLAQDRLATADLVVLVFDASAGRTDEERSLRESWPLALQVYNKCDLMADSARPSGEVAGQITTSATQSIGIDELGREIGRRLVPQPPAAGEAVPFTAEQMEMLAQVRAALLAGEIAGAGRLLAAMFGSPGTG
jgi:tRNA modification GTPase